MSFLSIAHYDLDSFFASVEQKLNPKLRNKPVIVCVKGVVSTASYEARKFGVKSGIPVFKARLLCPSAFFIKGNFNEYKKHGDAVFEIMSKFSPNIERTNLDEGFLDFTGCESLYPDTFTLCKRIKDKVKKEVELTLSIGLAKSRVYAKIACKLAKPDGLFAIEPGSEKETIYPLSIEQLPGVGPKTEEVLKKIGIKTIGDVACNKEQLESIFGKTGTNIYIASIGIDNIWFRKRDKVQSVGRSTTFPKNTNDINFILSMLFGLCDEVFYELEKNNLNFSCLSVTIRYANFQDREKCKTLSSSPQKLVDFYKIACRLLFEIWDKKTILRLIGIKASKLNSSVNQSFFSGEQIKARKVDKVIIYLREKFGEGIIQRALTQKY